jgi:hypothetical protein
MLLRRLEVLEGKIADSNDPATRSTDGSHEPRDAEDNAHDSRSGSAVQPPAHPFNYEMISPQHFAPSRSPLNSILSSESPNDGSAYGTLMLGKGGRSKYLGPTAGSDWLKDVSLANHVNLTVKQQVHPDESQNVSRAPSPEPGHRNGFPFHCYLSTQELLARLPRRQDTARVVECYYRYFAWQ